MMVPSYRHIAMASLVSAFAWIDASVNRRIRGKSYKKYNLHEERDAVLAHPDMVGALQDAFDGTPDEGSTKRRYYHNWKDIIPTFLETAQALYGKEEMPSKYISFVAVSAGFITCLVMVIIAAVIWVTTW